MTPLPVLGRIGISARASLFLWRFLGSKTETPHPNLACCFLLPKPGVSTRDKLLVHDTLVWEPVDATELCTTSFFSSFYPQAVEISPLGGGVLVATVSQAPVADIPARRDLRLTSLPIIRSLFLPMI